MPLGEFQEDLYVGDSLPMSGPPSTPDVGHEAATSAKETSCGRRGKVVASPEHSAKWMVVGLRLVADPR
jgi:hypothetical protein